MNVCECPCQKISCLHVVYVCTCVGTRVVKTTPTTDEKMSTKVEIGVMQKFLVTEVTEAGQNIFVQLDTPEAYQVQDLSESATVYFTDYAGNSETVETSSIYPPTGDSPVTGPVLPAGRLCPDFCFVKVRERVSLCL